MGKNKRSKGNDKGKGASSDAGKVKSKGNEKDDKGKGVAPSPSNDPSHDPASADHDQVLVCVEFVEADLAYTVNLDPRMQADLAFAKSVQQGMEKYPQMTGIAPAEFVQYPIEGLKELTLGEWAERCYHAGAPPTVLLSTGCGKGLLTKCKVTSALVSAEVTSAALSKQESLTLSAEKEGLETRMKSMQLEATLEEQAKEQLEIDMEKLKSENRKLKEEQVTFNKVEKAKASTCEENLAKVLLKLDELNADFKAFKEEAADSQAKLSDSLTKLTDENNRLRTQVAGLNRTVQMHGETIAEQRLELTAIKAAMNIL